MGLSGGGRNHFVIVVEVSSKSVVGAYVIISFEHFVCFTSYVAVVHTSAKRNFKVFVRTRELDADEHDGNKEGEGVTSSHPIGGVEIVAVGFANFDASLEVGVEVLGHTDESGVKSAVFEELSSPGGVEHVKKLGVV